MKTFHKLTHVMNSFFCEAHFIKIQSSHFIDCNLHESVKLIINVYSYGVGYNWGTITLFVNYFMTVEIPSISFSLLESLICFDLIFCFSRYSSSKQCPNY